MALVDFYHYTSENAADAIMKSGIIRESQDDGRDAHLGTGKIHTETAPTPIPTPAFLKVHCGYASGGAFVLGGGGGDGGGVSLFVFLFVFCCCCFCFCF